MVCRGGWLQAIDMKDEEALKQPRCYYNTHVHSDINKADNIKKNPKRVEALMRSYARNQGSQVPNTVLVQDVANNDETSINEETVATYLKALRKIFVIEDMPAWNPNLRSKTAIRSSNTRYYIDSSIAVTTLGLGPDDLINDLRTFGFLFETLCIRDLRIYTDSLSGEVYHYRDKDDQKCDAVIHLRNEKSIDHSLEYCASIYACFIGLRKVISLLFSALQDRHSFSLHLPISSYKLWIAFL